MRTRLKAAALLSMAIVVWWPAGRLTAWLQRVTGWDTLIANEQTKTILGHWVAWQLPTVLLCAAIWLVGTRLGVMPRISDTLKSGGSWRRVCATGLLSTGLLLAFTVGLGAALGGRFGFHPPFAKMVGDLVSNLYEEFIHRGFVLCVFYAIATGSPFPFDGPLNRLGGLVAAVGSSVTFAAVHTQYPVGMRVVMVFMSIPVWAWPFIRARSLWASWIPHTLGDVVGDSILKL